MFKNKSKNDKSYDDMIIGSWNYYEKENSIKVNIVYL
jgi:hypothetical protein